MKPNQNGYWAYIPMAVLRDPSLWPDLGHGGLDVLLRHVCGGGGVCWVPGEDGRAVGADVWVDNPDAMDLAARAHELVQMQMYPRSATDWTGSR